MKKLLGAILLSIPIISALGFALYHFPLKIVTLVITAVTGIVLCVDYGLTLLSDD